MRIDSDLHGALDDAGTDSGASEMEVMRPHLIDQFNSMDAAVESGQALPVPERKKGVNWIVVVAVVGILGAVLGALGLAFGGMLLSALAFLWA